MTNANTLSRRHNLHPLGACAFCGAQTGLYTTYLLVTRSMAAVCEDPILCLHNRQKQSSP